MKRFENIINEVQVHNKSIQFWNNGNNVMIRILLDGSLIGGIGITPYAVKGIIIEIERDKFRYLNLIYTI